MVLQVVTNYTQASGPSGSPEERQRSNSANEGDYWHVRTSCRRMNPQLAKVNCSHLRLISISKD